MKCKNCGAKIDENSKFCIYCGAKVENTLSNEEEKVEELNLQENNVVEEPIIDQSLEKNKEIEEATDTIITEPKNLEGNVNIPDTMEKVNNDVNGEKIVTEKKKNNKLPLIILISILALGILGGIAYVFFNNKNTKYTDNVIAAFNNLKNVKSATINASLDLEGKDAENLKFSLESMFSVENEKANLYAKVNKSMLFDEMNLYVTIDKENVGLYTESSVIDLLGATKSDSLKWINYSMNLKDSGVNFDEIISEEENENFEEIFDEKHLKYLGKENNLNKYQLLIDEEIMSKLNNKVSNVGQIETLSNVDDITIDIYLKNNNEIAKISIDMTKSLEDLGFKKAILTLELSNINNTKVSIPTNIINGAETLEKYISENSVWDGTELEYEDEL